MSVTIRHNFEGDEWNANRPVAPMPWAFFKRELLSLYSPPLRARATYAKVRQTLDLVEPMIGNGTTADLTPALVARFITERPETESAYTTIGHLRNLRMSCNYAVSSNYLAKSPFSFRKVNDWIRLPLLDDVRHHTLEEMARVIELAQRDIERRPDGSWSQWRARRLFALLATVAYTGMRKNEALFLRVEDIDLEHGFINIVSRRNNRLKTPASAQPIPIPNALAIVLAAWRPHLEIPADLPRTGNPNWAPKDNPESTRDAGWVFPNAYRTAAWTGGSKGYRPLDRLRRLGERAGVPGLGFQSLRHTWATHAESAWGFSEAMIKRVLRHTTMRTQKSYRHPDVVNLRTAVKDVAFGKESTLPVKLSKNGKPIVPPAVLPVSTGRPYVRKIDDAQAAEMRRLREEEKWTYAELVAHFNVSKSTVHYTLYQVVHKEKPNP